MKYEINSESPLSIINSLKHFKNYQITTIILFIKGSFYLVIQIAIVVWKYNWILILKAELKLEWILLKSDNEQQDNKAGSN